MFDYNPISNFAVSDEGILLESRCLYNRITFKVVNMLITTPPDLLSSKH